MKRILFVEDNKVLLQLYGLLFAGENGQWEAVMAADGQAAMELLRQSSFDVVASDIQMPGMSGIELLAEVRRLHPQTSRIIISGLSNQAEAADALNSTHLFIPKPLDSKKLRAALARICSLDAYLQDDRLRSLAGRMRVLPSFPLIYLEITREIESPNSSIQNIAQIVAKDPGIIAKILQVANSAAIGLPEKVHDPVEAVQQLGMATVRSLALSAQVFSSFKPGRLKHFSAVGLWSHLMKCGDLARALMHRERAGFAEAEDAFTAGLLHDLGQLMLADSLPDELEKSLVLAAQEKIPLHEAELEIFGATHTALGAYLFGLWGLPAPIVEAVAFHHTPQKSDLKQFSALTAVHVANALADESEADNLNLDYLAQIKVADRLTDWRETAVELQMKSAG
jgi:HD-like signal output (HDOD) protein/CheY-like chemotaxis protein